MPSLTRAPTSLELWGPTCLPALPITLPLTQVPSLCNTSSRDPASRPGSQVTVWEASAIATFEFKEL